MGHVGGKVLAFSGVTIASQELLQSPEDADGDGLHSVQPHELEGLLEEQEDRGEWSS